VRQIQARKDNFALNSMCLISHLIACGQPVEKRDVQIYSPFTNK